MATVEITAAQIDHASSDPLSRHDYAILNEVEGSLARGLQLKAWWDQTKAGGPGAKRFPTALEFPTVAESGVPGFDVAAWYAFFAPAKTPPEIVNKLSADTIAILREPAVIAAMEKAGVAVVGSTPAELGRMLKSEIDLWGPVIKAAGIKSEE